jgi:glycosyltransferase involved in cell wall biosynthesis
MASIDVLLAMGDVDENWPRVGLEAMASGVPVIAPNRWGWREMIQDDSTGMLCETDDDVMMAIEVLAHNKPKRERIARAARKWVEDYAASDEIWQGWEKVLFGGR